MITKNTIAAWVLAVFFIFMGIQKLGTTNLIFATIAEQSGIHLFEPVLRLVVGLSELIAALLLVLAPVRMWGALMGLGIMMGAVGFHLSPWLGIAVPMEAGAEPSTMLFIMALVFTALNLLLVNFEKGRLFAKYRQTRP